MEIKSIIENRFEIREKITDGGMGATFRAWDKEQECLVAVKTPHLGTLDTPDTKAANRRLKRFVKEAYALAEMHHPSIPKIYKAGLFGDRPYFAMELIDGVTLQDFLRRNQRPGLAEVAALGTVVAETLTAIGERNYIHRDLKPENIMITHVGRVFVIDFGIALATVGDPTRYTNETVGTEGYMPPERIDRGDCSVKSDLYSLGCVLYLMVAGREPFDLEAADLREQHRTETPKPLRTWRPDIPPELDDLVLALLAKNKDDRPSSSDVDAGLARYLPAPGDPAPNPGYIPDLTLPIREPSHARVGTRRSPASGLPQLNFDIGRPSERLTRAEALRRLNEVVQSKINGNSISAINALIALRSEAIASFGRSHAIVKKIDSARADMHQASE